MYYNGEWGTVCNDGWDDTEANVVCRQLGIGLSGTAILNVHIFGAGTGRVFLSNLNCSINDTNLFNCFHHGIGILTPGCDHYKDAGVTCNSKFNCNL